MRMPCSKIVRFAWLALAATGCAESDDNQGTQPVEAGGQGDAATLVDSSVDASSPQDAALDAGGLLDARPAMDATGTADVTQPSDASAQDATRDATADAAPSDAAMSNAEPGRLAGITAAHNNVRAMVQTTPSLPPLVWSPTIAAYAQEWADNLASTACNAPMHRSSSDLQKKGYGENLAAFIGVGPSGSVSTVQQAVDSWAGEVSCWTYGTISAPGYPGTEKCNQTCYMAMHSDGCGHYTQIVWRKSTELGCGVATCNSTRGKADIWICNYSPAGNFVGQTPY